MMYFRILVSLLVLYFLYRLIKRLLLKKEKGYLPGHYRKGEELVQDPQCGTYVPVSDAQHLERNGEKVYFCSRECREKYIENDKDQR
jgi:YHS domain-containing protein